MKKAVSAVYFSWLMVALLVTLCMLVIQPSLVWLGVFAASAPPLLNVFWRFDDGRSPSSKARYPKLSLLTMLGVAWVLLTVPEPGLPLWLALGCLAGLLLHGYWAVEPSP